MQSTTDSIQTLKKSTHGRRAARRGVSLLEVLIVLVILVVGILAVIRLFPSGFFSVNSAGNAALADSLGSAAIASGTQDISDLPDAILPGSAGDITQVTTGDANYDPDDPNNLENARIVSSERFTVPSQTIGGAAQCVYPVKYGPIVMGVDFNPPQPTSGPPVKANFTQLPKYLAVNSLPWQPISGDSTDANSSPQSAIFPRHQTFLVDLTKGMIAVPFAPYTPTGTTPVTGTSYDQKMVVMLLDANKKPFTYYLNVPQGTPTDTSKPADQYAPFQSDKVTYLPDTANNYQGGWFDPTGASGNNYIDTTVTNPNPTAPTLPLTRVVLYRPFQPKQGNVPAPATTFDNDPYEFTLPNPNIVRSSVSTPPANIGAILFNPFAAGGNGVPALTAQVSYQTYRWDILREDHDIPALSVGQTSVQRLTLKNIERTGDKLAAGEQQSGMTIFQGLIPDSNVPPNAESILILDLNTGLLLPQADINDSDKYGPSTTGQIDFSSGLGRLIVPSQQVTETSPGNVTPLQVTLRRVRIFYAAQGDWTVAVQKAPRYYTGLANYVSGTDPQIGSEQFAYSPGDTSVYFPRSDAGKTVEIDGTYTTTTTGGTAQTVTHSFSDAVAISDVSPTDPTLGNYRAVNLSDTAASPSAIPSGAANVTFTSVRGLSARAVVAWKERSQWKVHSVDTILNRPQQP